VTLARCLREQRACLEYLKGDGPDKAGARAGLRDWFAEEVEIRLKQKLQNPYCDDRSEAERESAEKAEGEEKR